MISLGLFIPPHPCTSHQGSNLTRHASVPLILWNLIMTWYFFLFPWIKPWRWYVMSFVSFKGLIYVCNAISCFILCSVPILACDWLRTIPHVMSSAWCISSVTSLMTSQWPWQLWIDYFDTLIGPNGIIVSFSVKPSIFSWMNNYKSSAM